jgi:hypothetical protein
MPLNTPSILGLTPGFSATTTVAGHEQAVIHPKVADE